MTPDETRRMSAQLRVHEGVRLKPYYCTADKLTIGVGRNLDDKGISESEATLLLMNDIQDAERDLKWHMPTYRSLTQTRKMVMLDMAFNLGVRGVMKFKKMHAALALRDYEEAARQMLDSRWAEQVGQRALTLAEMMRTNEPKW